MKYGISSNLYELYRIKKGLARYEVAKHLKFSQQFYGRIEKGVIGLPKNKLERIAKLLNIKPDTLRDALVRDFENDLRKHL